MSNFTWKTGSCLDPTNWPTEKADLILFDPPFWPRSQAYRQMSRGVIHKLETIACPDAKHYAEWWSQLMQLCRDHLKPTGWLVFKADHYMAKRAYAATSSEFDVPVPFYYQNTRVWDKGYVGMGYYIRNQCEYLEHYRMVDAKGKPYKAYFYNEPILLHSQNHGDNRASVPSYGTYVKLYAPNKPSWAPYLTTRNEILASITRKTKYRYSSVRTVPSFNLGARGEIGRRKLTVSGAKNEHINRTPLDVWIPTIHQFCPPGGLVVDPTAGSGSIYDAIRHAVGEYWRIRNVRYWGIELEQKYRPNLASRELGLLNYKK